MGFFDKLFGGKGKSQGSMAAGAASVVMDSGGKPASPPSSPSNKTKDAGAASKPASPKSVAEDPGRANLMQEINKKKGEIESFAAVGGVKVVKEGVMGQIAKAPSELKHVEGAADRSAPVIESDVTLKMNPMAALKEELVAKGSSPALKHVEESADRSSPMVEAGVTVKPSPMAELAKEIQAHTPPYPVDAN